MPDQFDDGLGLPPLDLGESMTMGEQPAAPPSSKAKAKDWAPLLALLPIAMAKGGRAGVAALLQGYQGARQQNQQTERQAQIDAERQRQTAEQERQRRAQLAQTTANSDALRRQQVLTSFQGGLEGLDNEEAVRAYLKLYGPQAQAVGLRPEALEGFAMEAVKPSRLQKKEADKVLAEAKKTYGDQAVSHTYTLKDGTQANWEELNRRAGVGLGPTVPTSTDKRGFQSKDVTVNGKRMLAGFNPDKNQYFAPGDTSTPLTGSIQEYERPLAPTGGEKPLTQNQRANIINSRRNQWTRFAKAVTDRQGSIAKIDSGLAALDRGNRNAATQAIILAFNKLQDETSVVREGEYARSEDLAPIVSRVEAFFLKLTQGGGVLTDAELRSLGFEAKELAKRLEAISSGAAASLRQGIEEELADYKIPTSRVFGGSTLGAGGGAAAPTGDTSVGGAWTDAGGGFKVREKR